MFIVPKRKIDISNTFEYMGHIFNSSTPCIIWYDDRYMIINRCNKKFSHMVNQVLCMDLSFNIVDYKIIPYTFQENLTCDGVEDVRIFNYKGIIYFIGVLRINSKYKVLYDVFDPTKELPHTEISVGFPTKFLVEKNWVFVIYKNRLCIIYKWYPLTICEIVNNNLVLLEEKYMPGKCKRFCGSSCGVHYKEHIWFLVHYHDRRSYKHIFVVFDKEMTFLNCSDPFIFEESREFSYGLVIQNDEIIVSYSKNNNSSFVCVYDYNKIRKKILVGCWDL